MRNVFFAVGLFGSLAMAACAEQESGPGSAPGVDRGAPASPVRTEIKGTEERRLQVEKGLRLPVRFEGEGPQSFHIEAGLERTGVPALSVAVINNGALDWQAGYGTMKTGSEMPVSETTLFQAASLSKPVTVLAAMRMREAGLLDFDEEIHAYLERYSLPEGAQTPESPVTIGNLLAHTSGMMPGGYLGYATGAEIPTDLETLEGRPPAEAEPARIVAEPGSRLVYSGAAYTLVEQALQDVTGKPFEVLMNVWVLEPLGMEASTFAQPLPADRRREAARGHKADGRPLAGGWRVHPEQAAGGLWATSGDLARVLIAIHRSLAGRDDFLSQDDAKALMSEQQDGHAYGFVLRGKGESLSMRHFGGNEGYRSMMILYPETGDGAVFLSNSDAGHELIAMVVRAVSDAYEWPDYRPAIVTRAELGEETLRSLAGRFRFDSGIEVVLDYDPERNGVSIAFPNGDIYELVPTGPGQFIHPETAVTVEFDSRDRVIVYGDTGVRVEG